MTDPPSARDLADINAQDVEMTVDDPAMYTRPFTVKFTAASSPDTDILEYIRAEGEKDLGHLTCAAWSRNGWNSPR